MADSSARWLYFGNYGSIDTDETNYTNENPSAVFATADKTTLQTVIITANDTDDSGLLLADDAGQVQETFTYDLGAGPITVGYDAESIVGITVTRGDGSQFTATVTLYQMDNGDVFLFEPDVFDFQNIQFVTIDSQISDNYNGTTTPLIADGEVDEVNIVCFTAGTGITTPSGEVAVENLHVGDVVTTLDHGDQVIRWIGRRHVSSDELARHPKLRPIRIAAGALGHGLPLRDLRVSPQHRILVSSAIAAQMVDAPEALVAAKHLLALDGIDVDQEAAEATYFHILFDQHEVILSEGAATESFYTGVQALKALDPEARAEIFALFPEIARQDAVAAWAFARPVVNGRIGRQIAARHLSGTAMPIQPTGVVRPDDRMTA